jgi:hypothetical protein
MEIRHESAFDDEHSWSPHAGESAMRKLKMSIDTLRVETFEVDPSGDGRAGTVLARGATPYCTDYPCIEPTNDPYNGGCYYSLEPVQPNCTNVCHTNLCASTVFATCGDLCA